MNNNLARLSQEEKDKINVDLVAASIAFKERYKMPVTAEEIVALEQPETLRDWFRQRLIYYRKKSLNLSCLPWKAKK